MSLNIKSILSLIIFQNRIICQFFYSTISTLQLSFVQHILNKLSGVYQEKGGKKPKYYLAIFL